MDIRELRVVYGTQKSFYGKALVSFVDGHATLFSYGTEIAKAVDGSLMLTDDREADYTHTTMKHLREFSQQFTHVNRLSLSDVRKALKADSLISNVA